VSGFDVPVGTKGAGFSSAAAGAEKARTESVLPKPGKRGMAVETASGRCVRARRATAEVVAAGSENDAAGAEASEAPLVSDNADDAAPAALNTPRLRREIDRLSIGGCCGK